MNFKTQLEGQNFQFLIQAGIDILLSHVRTISFVASLKPDNLNITSL